MASDNYSASRFDSAQGTHGQVSVRGEDLVVEFRYSPVRVEAIKRIPQARFHRDTKLWTVPIRHYELLRESDLFNRELLHYTFTEESLRDGLVRSGEDFEAAVTRHRENPFATSEADLVLLELDVVFRLSAKSASLRAFPRFRSKVKALLDKLPRAHFLSSEKAYFFPVEELNSFLKLLRDRKFRFAVEETAGAALSASAELRGRILRYPESAEGWEFRTALLGPYIDFAQGDFEDSMFGLGSFTTEQLKILFPGKMSYSERRSRAAAFDEAGLLKLLTRARSVGEQIWLSGSVHSFLSRSRARYQDQVDRSLANGFDQALLSAAELPLCWIFFEDRAGLLVARDEYERTFDKNGSNPLAPLPKELSNAFPDRYLFRIRDSKLPGLHEAVSGVLPAPVPESVEFRGHLASIKSRASVRAARDRYQSLDDMSLAEHSSSSPDLAEKLYPHQRVAVKWLIENSRAFLGDDMGLGKTLSVLACFDYLRATDAVDFLLVICPNSLCRNWRREAEHWIPKRKLSLLPPDKSDKIHFFKQLGWGGVLFDGLIVNYEAVRLEYVLEGLLGCLQGRKVMLCLDESQRVKTPSSKTFKAISEIIPSCDRRVLLSGTPTPKDISDIWAQMRLLDDGERFGTHFYDWLGRVAELGNKYSEFGVKRFYPEEVEEVVLRVHELLLRRKKEDVVNLPEKTFLTRDVDLAGDQLKRYDEVRKDLLLRVTSAAGKTFVREIHNILEEYLRAVQIAVNPRLVDENWKGEPAKFRELDLLVEEIVGEREEKLVVWTNFLGNVRELVERYSHLGCAPFSGEVSTAARDKTIGEFQNGKDLKILVAVPAAGGVGITLTAAQTAIYLDKTWNAEHWLQSIDRIHRIGQRGTVRIISLHSCKVDDLIARNLERKAENQAALLGDDQGFFEAGVVGDDGEVGGLPTREEFLEALMPKAKS